MRAVIAGFSALALSAAASAAPSSWLRSITPDGAFSIETPCSASEIEKLRQAPEDLGTIQTKRESRVLCRQDNLMTVATVLEIGQTDKSAFDLLLAEIEKDVSGGPKPKLVTIDGRRAVLNREEDKGYTAQNGLIDLGGGKVIILLVGIEPGSKAGPMERAEMIDRFTYSIKVAGQ